MTRILGIHQPEHLPWLGFFNKMSRSTKFVLLDNVPFRKNYFQNRNKIKGPNGSFWLTVPVLNKSSKQLIKDVKIDNSKNWQKDYLRSIELAYKKTPYFERYFNPLSDIINTKYTHLADLNEKLICYFASRLSMYNFKLVRTSTLNVSGSKSELLLNICKKLNYSTYLSGISGRDYLDMELFKKNGVRIIFQDFQLPSYAQRWGEFIPNLSTLDLLFNKGKKRSKECIECGGYKDE